MTRARFGVAGFAWFGRAQSGVFFLCSWLAGCTVAANSDDAPEDKAPKSSGGGGAVGEQPEALGGTTGDGAQGHDGVLDGYPPGPYAGPDPQVGEVVPNLRFEGIVSDRIAEASSREALRSTTFGQLRDGGARVALLHTATIWCPSCRAAADALAERAEELEQKGVLVLELVLEGASTGSAPTESELRTWMESTGLSVTTLRAASQETRDVFVSREFAYVIDLSTMEVVWSEQALYSTPTITELGTEAALDYLSK